MTVPVPLTDIEDELIEASKIRRPPLISRAEAMALTKALRIAVEGLNDAGRWDDGAFARRALAAVRELVDLGGDDA